MVEEDDAIDESLSRMIDIIDLVKNITGKKIATIPEDLGISDDDYENCAVEVFGNVFARDTEKESVRRIFPNITDTRDIAKIILYGKAIADKQKSH